MKRNAHNIEMSSVKMEIATIDNYKNFITVSALEKNVNKILTATTSINNNQWTIAVAINNIMEKEMYKKDFETQEKFAGWMGLDNSTISKYTKAVKFTVNVLGPKYGLTMKDVVYTKAVRYAQLGTRFDDFIAFAKGKGIDNIFVLSVHALEELMKEFKESLKPVKAVNDEEPTEEPTEEEKKQEVPSFTGRYDEKEVWFEVNGCKYIIPLSELKHYKVK